MKKLNLLALSAALISGHSLFAQTEEEAIQKFLVEHNIGQQNSPQPSQIINQPSQLPSMQSSNDQNQASMLSDYDDVGIAPRSGGPNSNTGFINVSPTKQNQTIRAPPAGAHYLRQRNLLTSVSLF